MRIARLFDHFSAFFTPLDALRATFGRSLGVSDAVGCFPRNPVNKDIRKGQCCYAPALRYVCQPLLLLHPCCAYLTVVKNHLYCCGRGLPTESIAPVLTTAL